MVGLQNRKDGKDIPLVSTSIHANLLDVIAEVDIKQTYINNSDDPIEATYKFPLNGNNAVHKFVAEIDGVVIVAKAMEKSKAVATYDDAISAGKGAYLLEQNDNDMLQISVGNLPPTKSVTLTISYVQELEMEDKETLRFSLLESLYSTFSESLSVHVKINMPLPILKITTFPPTSTPALSGTSAEVQFPVTHVNPGPISVLVRLGPGLGRPRLWVEKWDPLPAPAGVDPLAVMLAVSPDIPSVTTEEQEIIFLLDCSGSMSGLPTQHLMYSMFHALKFIPSSSTFNIVSFGSSFEFLFPESVFPTFEKLYTARKKISKLPSLGGTSLLQPMREIFKRQSQNRKRHLILLTDGEVDNRTECIEEVTKNRKTCSVSTIGIGRVDTNLVESIAKEGNGKCEIISNIENLESIMSVILKGTTDPAFDRVNILWYDSNGGICNNVKKAPEKLPPIYAGELYKVYGLVPTSDAPLARAQLQAMGKAGNLNMDIDLKSAQTDTHINGKLIHVLAAKQLIRELQEGAFRKNLDNVEVEKEVVRLGVSYSLASKHTSFVAVEERRDPVQGTMTSVDMNAHFSDIEGDIQQVHALFADLGALVQSQGTQIDQIEYRHCMTDDWLPDSICLSGHAELKAAAMYQKSRRRKIIFVILGILLLLVTIALLLIFIIIPRSKK